MSDKYYLHDCNSYTHCCQNTYRIEHKAFRKQSDDREEEKVKKPESLTWWQRLWERQAQTLSS